MRQPWGWDADNDGPVFVKTQAPTFRVRVMDWDADSADEWLMSPESLYSVSATSGSFTYDFGRSRLSVILVNAPGQ